MNIMIKLIHLKGKRSYICAGTSCKICKLRFECFTDNGILQVDWQNIHSKYKGSPSLVLRGLVGGKVFVEGSKKFVELIQQWDKIVTQKI